MTSHELQYRNNCVHCNKRFSSAREDAKYCSARCRKRAQREREKDEPVKLPASKKTIIQDDFDHPDDDLNSWDPNDYQYDNMLTIKLSNGDKFELYPVYCDSQPENGKYRYRLYDYNYGPGDVYLSIPYKNPPPKR